MQRSNTLDIIRGLAIFLVVSFHYFPRSVVIGWTGVNLFFVLSGFLIAGILIDNQASRNYYTTFYARRVFRIVPLYAINVALFAIVVGLDQPLWHYVLFIQNFTWIARGTVAADWMSPTWSLAVEEQFYLLLPLILRLAGRRLPIVAGGAILAAPVYRVFMTQGLGTDWPAANLTLPGELDSLFLGVLIAWAVRAPPVLDYIRQRRVRLWLMAGVGAVGMVVHFARAPDPTSLEDSLSLSWIALTYALVFTGLVTQPPSVTRRGPLCWLGVGAYSIYLFHMPVVMLLPTRLLALAVLLVVAVACWYGIERPLIGAARRRWQYRGNRPPDDDLVLAAPGRDRNLRELEALGPVRAKF